MPYGEYFANSDEPDESSMTPKFSQQQRARKHRDKWKEIASADLECTTGPRLFNELGALGAPEILRLENGFPSSGEAKLALQELHTKEERQCSCTRATTKVNAVRRQLGKPIGSPFDRGKSRYVCPTDANCNFCVGLRYAGVDADCKWSFSNYTPHTCQWHPSDSKAALRSRELQTKIDSLQVALAEAEAAEPTATTAMGKIECRRVLLELRQEAVVATRAGGVGEAFLHKHRHYSVEQLAWGLLAKTHGGQAPSSSEARNYMREVTGAAETPRFCYRVLKSTGENC